jgi:hypothetical protein
VEQQSCLRIKLDHRAEYAVLRLEGCLCRYGCVQPTFQIAQVLQTAGTTLVDLSRLTIIDHTRALVLCYCTEPGRRLAAGSSGAVRRGARGAGGAARHRRHHDGAACCHPG